jgi:two-component sensor histidine kinase
MILGSSAETGTRVRLDLQCEQIGINLDAAVPLSLIASELVINALKHGFAGERAGVLTIKLRAGVDLHELTVQDDGQGLPPDFEPEQSSGIGIELVGSLTRQIRGQREFQSGPGGTIVTIRWPAQRGSPEEPDSVAKIL